MAIDLQSLPDAQIADDMLMQKVHWMKLLFLMGARSSTYVTQGHQEFRVRLNAIPFTEKAVVRLLGSVPNKFVGPGLPAK